MMNVDGPREACGVFAICAPGEDVARVSFFALYALQHRGQESAGIATADGVNAISVHKRMGLVAQVFVEDDLRRLTGSMAIAHNRYSTTGSSQIVNAQPIVVTGPSGELALGHNGNLVNAAGLKQDLARRGIQTSSTTDSEIIAHLVANEPGADWVERVRRVVPRLHGAFSLVMLTRDQVIAVRDPWGIRPLSLGTFSRGGWVVASETCALDTIGARFVRDVAPGEIVVLEPRGVKSHEAGSDIQPQALCVFEYIYLARPDSVVNGRLVYLAREEMGRELARQYPVDADMVFGVPDTGSVAAIGFSHESGIPLREGIIKNRYIGRTFIAPSQSLRELGASLKYNPLPEVFAGKRVVVVDDSIVRGTTKKPVVKLLRQLGAKEVHVRISAPPLCHPCFFGVDIPTTSQLIAANMSVEQIRDFMGADSLGYQTLEGLGRAVQVPNDRLCRACFTGEYPMPVQLEMDKLSLEQCAR